MACREFSALRFSHSKQSARKITELPTNLVSKPRDGVSTVLTAQDFDILSCRVLTITRVGEWWLERLFRMRKIYRDMSL